VSSHPHDIRNEDGQALVEFALVLPVLVLVLFSIIHFGKAFNYWNDATHLTAEAARFAAVNRKPDLANAASLQQQIKDQVDSGELKNGTGSVTQAAQVCVSFPNGTSSAGDPVRVTLTFKYAWMPLIRDGLGKPLLQTGITVPDTTVTSSTVMRLETAPTNFSAGCA
jgi:Flp pilus assembly protein TadG